MLVCTLLCKMGDMQLRAAVMLLLPAPHDVAYSLVQETMSVKCQVASFPALSVLNCRQTVL